MPTTLVGGYNSNQEQSLEALKKATIISIGDSNRDALDVGEVPPVDIRFDPNDSLPDYIGLNFGSHKATTSTTSWTIFKLTYSGSNVTRIQRQDNIAWDSRTSGWS